jgi:hypothetical protein
MVVDRRLALVRIGELISLRRRTARVSRLERTSMRNREGLTDVALPSRLTNLVGTILMK